MRALPWLPLILFACGDNKGVDHPDAKQRPDAAPDAPPIAKCDYNEAADATNDNFFGLGSNMPEMTNVTFDGTAPIGICGKLNSSHYGQAQMVVDVDSYTIHVGATGAILHLTAPGAEALNTVLIEIYNNTTGQDQTGKFIRDHATAAIELEQGDYIIDISSFHGQAIAADIDYKLGIYKDEPRTRCGKLTATANYTEALDGANADGNDIYEIRFTGTMRQFTANANDMVEPTGIMAAPGGKYRISGINSLPGSPPPDWADKYQDRDTYQITMDANELSLRLNWPGTTADLDFYVFPMATLSDFALGWKGANMEDEFATTAVIPGMSYWVFVGANDTTTGQPINYDLSVCADTFSGQ